MTPPAVLIDQARALVHQPDAEVVGVWPRAAALLGRRALEEALDGLWAKKSPGLADVSARAQLTCLPAFLNDASLASDVAYTWTVLSDACHHHAYEVGPTAAELEHRLDVVRELVDRLG